MAPTATTSAAIPGDATINELPNTDAAALTLGRLVDRVDVAWTGIKSYRAISTGRAEPGPALSPLGPPVASPTAAVAATPAATPVGSPAATPVGIATPGPGATPIGSPTGSPSASPVASPALRPQATPVAGGGVAREMRSVLEVELPDRLRLTRSGFGENDFEAIKVGERIYLRGPLVERLLPGTAPEAWVSMTASEISPSSPLADVLQPLTVPERSPLAAAPARLRPQEIRDLGPMEVSGRMCHAYGAADTTELGRRVDITIAVDDQQLPCLIESKVGAAFTERTVYEGFNEDLRIAAPGGATPIAG
ncbi:MAG: hypothetical protein IT337_00050 [Thermomicrobiales bacterium]|nr:hypothetical protein [Thermomicrobiales bacterium]